MKSNWNTTEILSGLKKSKTTILALALGLTLGVAAGQVVHSSNEPCKGKDNSAASIPVQAAPSCDAHRQFPLRRGLGVSLMFDPWLRSVMYDPFSDWVMGDFENMPVAFAPSSAVASPRLDVTQSANEVKVNAEVPGIDEKDLDVSVSETSVTIKGEKKRETSTSDKNSPRAGERVYGMFERTFSLPCRVNSDQARATLKNGVLTIVMPKSQTAPKESKKLAINTQ